jgi:glycerophosphoryl diester phosphodiesterase
MEGEELAQFYYQKLVDKEAQPAVILTQFYSTFYNLEFNPVLVPFFGRMVKLYGRNMTFNALLDLFEFEEVQHDKIHRLIAYLVKKRMEGKFSIQETVDLSSDTKNHLKELKRAMRAKPMEEVEDPFN